MVLKERGGWERIEMVQQYALPDAQNKTAAITGGCKPASLTYDERIALKNRDD